MAAAALYFVDYLSLYQKYPESSVHTPVHINDITFGFKKSNLSKLLNLFKYFL